MVGLARSQAPQEFPSKMTVCGPWQQWQGGGGLWPPQRVPPSSPKALFDFLKKEAWGTVCFSQGQRVYKKSFLTLVQPTHYPDCHCDPFVEFPGAPTPQHPPQRVANRPGAPCQFAGAGERGGRAAARRRVHGSAGRPRPSPEGPPRQPPPVRPATPPNTGLRREATAGGRQVRTKPGVETVPFFTPPPRHKQPRG